MQWWERGIWSIDDYVASTRAHWGPRFTANGVPAADFDRVMGGLESWDQWCTAWSAAARVHEGALVLTLTMADRASSLQCPTLVIAGNKDRLIPWQQAQRLHHEVSGSEFLLLEDGNHGCANVLAAHRYRTADWMAAQLNPQR